MRCRRGVDTRFGLSLSNSVAQSVPSRAMATVPCFHEKFTANWSAKFVHCHVHLWCLLYEGVRSAYSVTMIGRECQKSGHVRHAMFDLTRRYGNENGNSRSAASGTLGKFCANDLLFCVTVDANWIVFRPKQVRLLV